MVGIARTIKCIWEKQEACWSRYATTDCRKTLPRVGVIHQPLLLYHNGAASFAAGVVAHVAVLGPVSVSAPPPMLNSGGSPEERESQCTSPLERVTVVSPVRGRAIALSSSQSPLKTRDHRQRAFAVEHSGSIYHRRRRDTTHHQCDKALLAVLLRCACGGYTIYTLYNSSVCLRRRYHMVWRTWQCMMRLQCAGGATTNNFP